MNHVRTRVRICARVLRAPESAFVARESPKAVAALLRRVLQRFVVVLPWFWFYFLERPACIGVIRARYRRLNKCIGITWRVPFNRKMLSSNAENQNPNFRSKDVISLRRLPHGSAYRARKGNRAAAGG